MFAHMLMLVDLWVTALELGAIAVHREPQLHLEKPSITIIPKHTILMVATQVFL